MVVWLLTATVLVMGLVIHPTCALAQQPVRRSTTVRAPRRHSAGVQSARPGRVGVFGLQWGSDTTDVDVALHRAGAIRTHTARASEPSYLIMNQGAVSHADYLVPFLGRPVIVGCHFRGNRLGRVEMTLDGGGTEPERRAAYDAIMRDFARVFGSPSDVVAGRLRQAMWARTPDGSTVIVIEGRPTNQPNDPRPAVMISFLPPR